MKKIVGGSIVLIGTILVILSFMPQYVMPQQVLQINTFGILIGQLGYFVMFAKGFAKLSKLAISLSLLLFGFIFVIYSFSITDPFTQLWVNSLAILVVLIGGTLLLEHGEEKSGVFVGGIILGVIGFMIMIMSLTPYVTQQYQLIVNTFGIMLTGFGLGITLKHED